MFLTRLQAPGIAEKQLSLYNWPITFKRKCFLQQACYWLLFSGPLADHWHFRLLGMCAELDWMKQTLWRRKTSTVYWTGCTGRM